MPSLESFFLECQNVKVIESTIPYSHYSAIDLSIANPELTLFDIQNPTDFEVYINKHLFANNAKVAFGGYNEQRNLYNKSPIFNTTSSEERNIHIGLDLWTKAKTPVLAALEGTVYGFGFNTGKGNYGPTIILEHQLKNHVFYTLYGHLSVDSIANLEIGNFFKKGQEIASLGDSSVNGGYSPHLHFQIIKNIEEYLSDYPGVCSINDLDFYLDNCPDPNLLLKIK